MVDLLNLFHMVSFVGSDGLLYLRLRTHDALVQLVHFVYGLWVLEQLLQVCLLRDAVLGPLDPLDLRTHYWKLDSISNKIGTFRHFEQLGIFIAISELADKPSFNLILSLGSLIMSILPLHEDLGHERSGVQRILVDQ